MPRFGWRSCFAPLATSRSVLSADFPLSADILALLPRDEQDPALRKANDAVARALGRHVIVLVGHPVRERARAAARQIGDVLAAAGVASSTADQGSMSQFRKIGAVYFPFRDGLLSEQDRNALGSGRGQAVASRALMQAFGVGFTDGALLQNDPFLLFPRFLMGLTAPISRLALDEGMLSLVENGTVWVAIVGRLDGTSLNLNVQTRIVGALSAEERQLTAADPQLKILRTGAVFFAEAGSQSAMAEASNLSSLSMLGTVVLILAVFRRIAPLLQNILTIVVGIICGVAATFAIFGEIHVIALLFGTSLIGTSVDYGLYYSATSLDPAGASPQARLRAILPSILLGLVTTLAGYGLLGLAPFPGLRQIAALSGIGLLAAFLTVALWLPLLDRRAKAPANAARYLDFVANLYEFWRTPRWRHGRGVLVLSAVAIVIIGGLRLKFDDDVRRLQQPSRDLAWQQKQIAALTGSDFASQYLLIQAKDNETALQLEESIAPIIEGLQSDGALHGYQAPAAYVPSLARQIADKTLVQEKLLAPLLRNQLSVLGLKARSSGDSSGGLTLETIAGQGGPAFLDDLILEPGLHFALLQGVTDSNRLAAALRGFAGVRLIDPAGDFSALFKKYREQAILLTMVSFCVILVGLALRYGALGAVAAMTPSLIALVLTPALISAAGEPLTFFHIMGLVLILAIAVDYAIFFAETAGQKVPVTMFGVTLAAATAQLSFGLLIVSSVPAMRHIGVTMCIGIATAFLLSPVAGLIGPKKARSNDEFPLNDG